MKTDQLIQDLSHQASLVRPMTATPLSFLGVGLFLSAWTAGWILLLGVRSDFSVQMLDVRYVSQGIGLLLAIILGTMLCLQLRVPALSKPILLSFMCVSGACLWAFLIAIPFLTHVPSGLPNGAACGGIFAVVSAASLSALLVAVRKGAPVHLSLTSALALCVAGATGAFVLHVHCPSTDLGHLFVWHFLPFMGAVSVGVFLLRRKLRW